MGRIKGWKTGRYENQWLNKNSDTVLTIEDHRYGWIVIIDKGYSAKPYQIQTDTKKQARKEAVDYMRRHPNG